jgi:hypothetical protein
MSDIRDFRGTCKGDKVFIIGNGPSLTPAQLDKISGRASFATNCISSIFHRTAWRPTYYVTTTTAMNNSEIRPYLEAGIIAAKTAFVWLQYSPPYWSNVCLINCLHETDEDNGGDNPWSDDLLDGVSKWGTGLLPIAQIAAWMGFSRLYFLGIDGTYTRGNAAHFRGYPGEYQYAQTDDAALVRAHEVIARNLTRLGIDAWNCTPGSRIKSYATARLEDVL